MNHLLSTILFLTIFNLLAANIENWPGWRGPQRTDISSESGLLKSWKEGGPTKLWNYENAGLGYGGPAIVGKQMFLLGTRDES